MLSALVAVLVWGVAFVVGFHVWEGTGSVWFGIAGFGAALMYSGLIGLNAERRREAQGGD